MIKVLAAILLSVVLATSSFAQADAKAAIISAAERYVASNSAIAGVRVTVEKVDGKYARAKATPRDPKKADPAWIFLQKKNDTWTGLTLGTGFAPEDYRRLRIPRSLWID
jgi:DNA-binding protein H-NS